MSSTRLSVPEWRIYYGDKTTFDSLMGTPEEAPSWGVQVIVHPDETYGRVLCRRWDWYYLRGDEWFGSDLQGLLGHLMHDRERLIHAVKQGSVLPTPLYEEIVRMARNDPDFPPQSATKLIEENRGLRY